MYFFGTEEKTVAYVLAEVGEPEPALVRRECDLGFGFVREQTIVHGVPGHSSVRAECPVVATPEPCEVITIEVDLVSGATLHTEAKRRGTSASLADAAGGLSSPYSSIVLGHIEPRTASSPYEVSVRANVVDLDTPTGHAVKISAPGSNAPSVVDLTYDHDNHANNEVTFSYTTPGVKQISITAVDEDGNRDTASRSVTLVNRDPVVNSVSIILSDGATVGIEDHTEYTFTANVYDPDSGVATVEWVLPASTPTVCRLRATNSHSTPRPTTVSTRAPYL
jgi:hypothetical protein